MSFSPHHPAVHLTPSRFPTAEQYSNADRIAAEITTSEHFEASPATDLLAANLRLLSGIFTADPDKIDDGLLAALDIQSSNDPDSQVSKDSTETMINADLAATHLRCAQAIITPMEAANSINQTVLSELVPYAEALAKAFEEGGNGDRHHRLARVRALAAHVYQILGDGNQGSVLPQFATPIRASESAEDEASLDAAINGMETDDLVIFLGGVTPHYVSIERVVTGDTFIDPDLESGPISYLDLRGESPDTHLDRISYYAARISNAAAMIHEAPDNEQSTVFEVPHYAELQYKKI